MPARPRVPQPAPPQAARVEPFSPAMWGAPNSGTLERQLEAQARASPRVPWRAGRVLLGVLVGLAFAVVNVYVGLQTGIIVFGSWYAVFLAGMALRWSPGEINVAAVASSGANFIVGGYAYVLPALFLAGVPLEPGLLATAIAGTALAGILGSLAFAAFRRAWIVEHPLPYPSFEQYVQLLALAQPRSTGRAGHARRVARLVGAGGIAAGAWAFLRDVPVGGRPLLGGAEATGFYGSAGLQQPIATAQLTWLNLSLSPLLVAVGWFMRMRIALVVMGGSALAWLLAAPLAVGFDVQGLAGMAARGEPAALAAFAGPVRALAAGALVGAGLTALARLAPSLRSTLGEAARARTQGRSVQDRYEWPPHHATYAALVLAGALTGLLVASGAPALAAVVVAVLVTLGILLLGAVAVKAAGETSLEPASGAGLLLALVLAVVLQAMGLGPGLVIALAVVGTAVFFAGITMMGNLLLDMKVALYVGNHPSEMMRAALLGIVPGALLGGLLLTILGPALASGELALAAPQARAYATLLGNTLQGAVPWLLLLLGAAIGVFAEWRTGLGTAFGLGMFLPIGIPGAFLLGAGLRVAWERRLARRALVREQQDLARSDTYLVATGLMVGEAVVATAGAILLALGA